MTAIHAEQRRRLYLAMLDNPEGITSKDFAAEPTIDGGEPIPRVAARIMELRTEHHIPEGLRDPQKYAIYRLAPPTPKQTAPASAFVRVTACMGCLSIHRDGFRCPLGHRTETHLTHHGRALDECRRQTQELRHAA